MTTAAPALERAEGLQLLGALGGSGYVDAPHLVRRADGQTLQLTPLLYALLDLLDGRRDLDDLARDLGNATGKQVTIEDVAYLVAEKLAPLGVLAGPATETAPKANPLLALRFKVVISDPAATRRLTAPFAVLFSPFVLWPVLVAFVGVCWFVLVDKGLASATHQAFDTPILLLAVFALTVASAGFHELGHAAACRYGGAQPGAMGFGLYLVWPAFYTDVDDSYRLDRRGRLRVDLGGLYFNAVVAVAVTALYVATGFDALLLGVATQLLQMLRQLAPIFRADGYHILADLTGVPDLFAHLGPTLRRVLPWHWHEPSSLRRRARWVVTAWVLVVVPVLASMMLTGVLLFPRLVATAWTSGRARGHQLVAAAERADLLAMGAAGLQLLALVLPVLGIGYLIGRTADRALGWLWTRTDGRPFLRGVATGTVIALLAALLVVWWPTGQYRPVSADERGTLPSLVQHSEPTQVSAQQTALAMVPRGGATEAHPALLLLGDGRAVITSGSRAGTVFPFVLPGRGGEGDNVAVAVNDTDGSFVYDVAVALVTLTDGRDVDNANAAYALASCTRCTTMAVAFQVVLVVGQSDVVAPANVAVAGNKACVLCVTRALATQLVVTLRALPSDEVATKLQAALASVQGARPDEVVRQVAAVQAQVLKTLEDEGLVEQTTTTTATASPSASSTDPAASASADAPSPSPSDTSSPAPTEAPTASTDRAPTSDPTTAPTADPSAAPTP